MTSQCGHHEGVTKARKVHNAAQKKDKITHKVGQSKGLERNKKD